MRYFLTALNIIPVCWTIISNRQHYRLIVHGALLVCMRQIDVITGRWLHSRSKYIFINFSSVKKRTNKHPAKRCMSYAIGNNSCEYCFDAAQCPYAACSGFVTVVLEGMPKAVFSRVHFHVSSFFVISLRKQQIIHDITVIVLCFVQKRVQNYCLLLERSV